MTQRPNLDSTCFLFVVFFFVACELRSVVIFLSGHIFNGYVYNILRLISFPQSLEYLLTFSLEN